ncbi:hypothetical protein GRF59_17805 [Paenibacillus sp. HJL G12]|uniref:Uncharacterized protein n=1 Tax=Paenibacillus dendrobii TaxID=2691084 RepID=A0A7X3INT1_9BACL|nr:hypothetical protein [Paenibacillus dendrobii]MWV45482.1 hypothetical protein [Paenibacillus dendrobii]
MIEKHNNAPKASRFSKRNGKKNVGKGTTPIAGFPQLADQLQHAAVWMREMEQIVASPGSMISTEWRPGIRIRHRQHPEYGTGMIRVIIPGGLSAYCSFDRFSLSSTDWTPSGYYRLSQLEIAGDIDKEHCTLL